MNNRQGGRRRGRGGQQSRNGQPGNPHSNSRVDNRQRGNAAQLLEKYKTLARDAQMAGDRVNTEYYLQFADHYFRVLSENRSRFEEQRRPRDDYGQEFGTEDDADQPQRPQAARDLSDDGWDDDGEDREGDTFVQPQRAAQPYRDQRDARGQEPRNDRGERGDRRQPYAPRENGDGSGRNGNGAARTGTNGNGTGASPELAAPDMAAPRIEFDRLPPSLSAASEPVMANEGEPIDAAPKRRRGRKPKEAGDPAEIEA